jgi:hypothetical protein
MATRKHLKLADNICQAGAKTAVVKTYPVPNAVVSEIDSSDMFLRQTKRKKDGKTHRYWSVVENKRAARCLRR